MLTLPLVKEYCAISDESNLNADEYLQLMIDASLLLCEKLTKRRIFENQSDMLSADLTDEQRKIAIVADSDIDLARLKMICDWYEHRGGIVEYGVNEVPNGIWAILQKYHIYDIDSVLDS